MQLFSWYSGSLTSVSKTTNQLRHCLHGRSFICSRVGFDAVTPFVYTAPVEFVIRTGSFWKRFQKWSIFKTIRFHWSCKRRNHIDLKTVTYFGAKLAGLHKVNKLNLARSATLCCTITTLICSLTSLFQLFCNLVSINREAYGNNRQICLEMSTFSSIRSRVTKRSKKQNDNSGFGLGELVSSGTILLIGFLYRNVSAP